MNAMVKALMRSIGSSCGAASALAAIQGASATTTPAYSNELIQVMPEDNARIRLALSGSEVLNSAMCLTTVVPMPSPAMPPIMPAVVLIMPYSPNPTCPRIRASRKETTMDTPRDTAKATPPQKAPRASRCRVRVPQ